MTFLVVMTGGEWVGASGTLWVNIRNVVKHPKMHRTAPHNKELSRQGVHGTEVENPDLTLSC